MPNSHTSYNDISLETEILSASNHRIIQMLLEKILQDIEIAKVLTQAKDITNRAKVIIRAWNVIEYLRLCLNRDDERSKKLANDLDVLYFNAQHNLTLANKNSNIQYLDHAKTILGNIKEGWDSIAAK